MYATYFDMKNCAFSPFIYGFGIILRKKNSYYFLKQRWFVDLCPWSVVFFEVRTELLNII
jgi:hypothetical protein